MRDRDDPIWADPVERLLNVLGNLGDVPTRRIEGFVPIAHRATLQRRPRWKASRGCHRRCRAASAAPWTRTSSLRRPGRTGVRSDLVSVGCRRDRHPVAIRLSGASPCCATPIPALITPRQTHEIQRLVSDRFRQPSAGGARRRRRTARWMRCGRQSPTYVRHAALDDRLAPDRRPSLGRLRMTCGCSFLLLQSVCRDAGSFAGCVTVMLSRIASAAYPPKSGTGPHLSGEAKP